MVFSPTALAFDPNNDIVLKTATTTLGITKQTEQAYTYSLSQNYPNPFNPNTLINFQVPEKANVTIKVYNAIGQMVSLLVNQEMLPGSYKVNFDGKNFPSGIYFYEMSAVGEKTNYSAVKKMLLVK